MQTPDPEQRPEQCEQRPEPNPALDFGAGTSNAKCLTRCNAVAFRARQVSGPRGAAPCMLTRPLRTAPHHAPGFREAPSPCHLWARVVVELCGSSGQGGLAGAEATACQQARRLARTRSDIRFSQQCHAVAHARVQSAAPCSQVRHSRNRGPLHEADLTHLCHMRRMEDYDKSVRRASRSRRQTGATNAGIAGEVRPRTRRATAPACCATAAGSTNSACASGSARARPRVHNAMRWQAACHWHCQPG